MGLNVPPLILEIAYLITAVTFIKPQAPEPSAHRAFRQPDCNGRHGDRGYCDHLIAV